MRGAQEYVRRQSDTAVALRVAGFIGGYYIWGSYSKFNEMLNLYLYSRIIYAFTQHMAKKSEEGSLPCLGEIIFVFGAPSYGQS